MKKICMFVCCVFVSMSAFAAKDCSDYGISVGEWLLEKNGSKWTVWKCENNKKLSPELTKEEKEIQFCDNPNESLSGWESRSFKGNAMLQVKTSDIKNGNINNTGNISLTMFNDKSTACFYCDDGYSYNSSKKECIQDMAQSCTQLSIEKCKNNTHLIESGGNGCYVCDNGIKASCRAGNRLFMRSAHIGKQEAVDNQVWECNPATKMWTHRSPGLCNGSVDLSADVSAGHATLELVNPARSLSHNNASSWVIDNGDICYNYTCAAGWVQSGGKCVQNADYKQLCEVSGGTYDERSLICSCADVLGLQQSTDKHRCECKAGADFEWNVSEKACKKTQAAQQREDKEQRQRNQQQNAKAACTNSGGDWNNGSCSCSSAKHLKLSSGECICESTEYAFNSSTKQCELTDVAKQKQICDSATSIATWNAIENKCICNDKNKTFDENTKNCISPDGYDDCIAHSDVAKWESGNCVCKQAGYNWNGSSCVETSDHVIDGIFDKISAIEAKFDTSKWKNAEGKFNTARLASDSIAGVVLGTVGGVVTSTVMKKSQVKNGFEDIKCVIGGQTVASYDDQFSVGLK